MQGWDNVARVNSVARHACCPDITDFTDLELGGDAPGATVRQLLRSFGLAGAGFEFLSSGRVGLRLNLDTLLPWSVRYL